MDLDSGIHTQAPVCVSSDGSSWLSSASLPTHTHLAAADKLIVLGLSQTVRTREEPLCVSCSHLHTDRIIFQVRVFKEINFLPQEKDK